MTLEELVEKRCNVRMRNTDLKEWLMIVSALVAALGSVAGVVIAFF